MADGADKRGRGGDGAPAGHTGATILPLVYAELRKLAADRLAREPSGHSLEPTALVHEAYLRLTNGDGAPRWENRAHFFAAAAEAMRRVLVDQARASKRVKRGGGAPVLSLDEETVGTRQDPENVLALDRVVPALEALDPELAETVKLRCFVGLSIAEVAEALGVSTRTIDRRWTLAKAWLKAALAEAGPDGPGRVAGSREPTH